MPTRRHLRWVAVLGLALLMLMCPLLFPAPAAASVADPDYRIQPGDALVVSVLGEADMGGTRAVGPGGTISLPIIGTVSVANRTLDQVRQSLIQALSKFIHDPFVTVALDETTSKRRVYVDGAVERFGSQMLPSGSTVLDAVVAAGVTGESDLSAVELMRADGESVRLDLSGLHTGAKIPLNLDLGWNDRIYVARYDGRVTLVGQVEKPGSYMLPQYKPYHLLDLLSQASGGFKAEADRRTLLLMREQEPQARRIDLAKLLKEGDIRENFLLQPGDVLVLPEAERVAVAGEVLQPTSFYANTKVTLLDAISRSGGFTPTAGLKLARVTHADGTAEAVNLDALWRRGDMSADRELRPGDVLMVPRADPEEVIFTGAVARAGSYDIRDVTDRGLVRALANVGYTAESDLTRVMLFRGADHRLLNARDLLEKGDASQDVTLAAGDVVYVPYWDKLTVMGAFGRPGQFPFDPKLSLMDYVAQAGGVVGAANDRGMVIRPKSDGTSETFVLDFSKLRLGQLPEAVKLQPGDIIYVQPKSGGLSFWERMRDFLFTFGAIRGLFN